MEEKETSYITFGAQLGDRDSYKHLEIPLNELNVLLDKYCYSTYSNQLDEFAPILRVDGEIWEFGFEGCERLRLYKKQRYITLDIGMPREKWQNKSSMEIKQFLIFHLENALCLFVQRLKKEKMDINEELLFGDFKLLKEEYLNN